MSDFMGLEILLIFVLIIANGFFSASEIAIVSARRGRLQQQIDAGNKAASQALQLSENPDRFLATVQIGITLISTLASVFGGASISGPLSNWLATIPLLHPYANTIALSLVVIGITYFTLVIGELAPKNLALQSAENIAISVAPLMNKLSKIARPIVLLLTVSANLLLRILGQYNPTKGTVTEEDIVYLAREGAVSGTVESEEEEFIRRIFRFTDRTVSSVMMPRTEIVAVEAGTPFSQVIETFMTSGYTRLPLYENSLDNIVGVIYAKDLLRSRADHQKDEDINIRALARPAFFISEFQHVNDLLSTFRRKSIHIAIVIDEYSQVTGLVTMEDILEELVGEIQDEYDQPEDTAIIQREDGSWLVDAMTDYETVLLKIGIPMDEEKRRDYHTLAGFILAHSGHIPKIGEKLTINDFVFEIIDMDGRRIDKVLIQRKKA